MIDASIVGFGKGNFMKRLFQIAGASLVAVVLAACGSGSFAPGTTHAFSHPRPGTSNYQVLHNFGIGSDGNNPNAGLIDVNGTLYGTTYGGGAYTGSGSGLGTVFNITTTGTENVLYNFGQGGRRDGAHPIGGLVALNGILYGTTFDGGANVGSGNGAGTAFSITTTGTESVLHSFGRGGSYSDGVGPFAGLSAKGGRLYGTTFAGGTFGRGVVFRITATGRERVLHSFGYGTDGRLPESGLVNVGGTLYGVTYGGGASNNGSVFRIDPRTNTESVLYSFQGNPDGSNPVLGSLIQVGGVLYGVTTAGGNASCQQPGLPGCGTVFAVTTSGQEHVVYSFKSGNDGANPYGGLFAWGGKLYGTTGFGGNTGCYQNLGCGTVFSVTPSGKERILHTFTGGSDGEGPTSNLLYVNGVLYGTTSGAGNSSDWGTVFSLTP